MKAILLPLSFLLCFVFLIPQVQAKPKDQTHHFKIKGSAKAWTPGGKRTVEYDAKSPDHLIISDFDQKNKLLSKGRFLFTGKEFKLSVNYLKYVDNNEIQKDGYYSLYEAGKILKTINYAKDEFVSQTCYYPNGKPQSLIPGEYWLQGEYKMWHPNGQLSFTGNFKGNKKEGDFEQFDESGKSIKKGVYQNNKLISGEPVVMDITYNDPDIPAEYEQGGNALNDYLTAKAAALGKSKIAYSGKKFDLQITFDEKGKMTWITNSTNSTEEEAASIKRILNDCPVFNPATVENVPVKSIQMFTLKISANGIKLDSEEMIYATVEKSPTFPGGTDGLKNYLKYNLHYPEQALQSRIEGKVFISFIVNKNGKVTDATIKNGIDPLLDNEALRVVRNMPDWEPGYMHEKPVRVSYTLPITFMLGQARNRIENN